MDIRLFAPGDEQSVAGMIEQTLRITNSTDYPPEEIERLVQSLSADVVLSRSKWVHLYVACEDGRVVGCGGIGPYWDSETESSFFMVFVHPDSQGQGVGRHIVETLEQDPYFLRAKRVEIPASITAVNFYKKFGYTEKPGKAYPDEEGLYRLEKFR